MVITRHFPKHRANPRFMDEIYIGSKETNRHASKKINAGRHNGRRLDSLEQMGLTVRGVDCKQLRYKDLFRQISTAQAR